jgi:surface antigen
MKVRQKVSQRIVAKVSMFAMIVSSSVLIGGSFLPNAAQMVMADSLQDQINSLNSQNDSTQSVISSLQSQAANYQAAISQLQQQIGDIQATISTNQTKQTDLQQQITADQAQIDNEKSILADDVKTMYVDGTPSTLIMLATSKNLSDFVDKQEYRTSVQGKLQSTLTTIAQLQSQLQTQKSQVDQLVKEEQSEQSQLDSNQAQENSLLSYNQSQQASYNAQVQANSTKIAQLEAEQAAENQQIGGQLLSGDPGHGGYPSQWDYSDGCSAAQNASNPSAADCPVAQDSRLDSWGMFNRECVSYTAFKVAQTYGSAAMPYWGGEGNAYQWPSDARADGIPTGSTPKAHSVAIWTSASPLGHAMWVEAVNSDGSILVSQYNYNGNGLYSEMEVSAAKASTFTYIYFN